MLYFDDPVDLIKYHEGFRAKPYQDPVSKKWTVGYGINLETGITELEAEAILVERMDLICEKLGKKYPWFMNLSLTRQAVVIDMAYNLGLKGLGQFKKMIKAMTDGDHEMVSHHMLDSLWAKQVKTRAKRLAKMWETDEWPRG